VKAVILAGGKGTRLKPYTTHFPKPLMPIGDKPILELVIEKLREAEIKQIVITTGHMSGMIESFFGNGKKFGVHITYSAESKPLGTGGPLRLIKDRIREDFLVMNGDVLTDLDFSDFITFHLENKNTATIAASTRKVDVDFGLVRLDKKNHFLSWKEKPVLEYSVSMGIYLFSPVIFHDLPEKESFGIPELIQHLHKKKQKIMGYLHRGYWLDIGRPDDYQKACKDFVGDHDEEK
jgi:NDP-sugar pyrophosphorylase family protein